MKVIKCISVIFIIFSAGTLSLAGDDSMEDYLSIYDFNKNDNNRAYVWEDFTDQVMGGKSEMSTAIMQEDGRRFIRMSGDVSVKNNGGFIQTRLKLASGLGTFDASDYRGIRLRVRGEGTGYYIFLRTSSTVFPWLHYKAPINTGEGWTTVDIPWSEVEKGDFGSPGKFKPSKLKSLALVAYGRDFRAEVDLQEIGLYR